MDTHASTDYFQPNDIERFIDIARHNKAQYNPTLKASVDTSSADKTNIASINSLQNKLLDNFVEQDDGDLDSSESDDVLNDILSSREDTEKSSDRNRVTVSEDIEPLNTEDDLDNLLGITKQSTKLSSSIGQTVVASVSKQVQADNSLQSSNSKPTPAGDQITKGQMSSLEDELDQLLSVDDDTGKNQPGSNPPVGETGHSTSK